jgi:hypothetical protein
LGKLAKVGNVIPKTLEILITYPTADSVENEYHGDYGNLALTIDMSGSSLLRLLRGTQFPPTLARPGTVSRPKGKTIKSLLQGVLK